MSADHAAGLPLQAWRLGGTPRCGIHGDDTSDGRCGSCDQVAYDQAQEHVEREREQREAAMGGDL